MLVCMDVRNHEDILYDHLGHGKHGLNLFDVSDDILMMKMRPIGL